MAAAESHADGHDHGRGAEHDMATERAGNRGGTRPWPEGDAPMTPAETVRLLCGPSWWIISA